MSVGKIPRTYRYKRKKLIAECPEQRLRQPKKPSKSNGSSSSSGNKENIPVASNNSADKENTNNNQMSVAGGSQAWLKLFSQPWDEVMRRWKESFCLRQRIQDDDNYTLTKILQEWPTLKSDSGYELVRIFFFSIKNVM